MAWDLNEALSLAFLSQEASLHIPMAAPVDVKSLPGLQWDAAQPFHSSALCAAAIDTATFPLRKRPNSQLSGTDCN